MYVCMCVCVCVCVCAHARVPACMCACVEVIGCLQNLPVYTLYYLTPKHLPSVCTVLVWALVTLTVCGTTAPIAVKRALSLSRDLTKALCLKSMLIYITQ